jgi:hypothetical protein
MTELPSATTASITCSPPPGKPLGAATEATARRWSHCGVVARRADPQCQVVVHASAPVTGTPLTPSVPEPSASNKAIDARPRTSCCLTAATLAPVSSATCATDRSAKWNNTIATRCARGSDWRAVIRATRSTSSGSGLGRDSRRRHAVDEFRIRRHRLTAMRRATVRTHASGDLHRRTVDQLSQARSNASAVTSSASAASPVSITICRRIPTAAEAYSRSNSSASAAFRVAST